jgi:phosphatidate cytidylyltransferase
MAIAWLDKWNGMRPELQQRIKTGVLGGGLFLVLALGLGTIGTNFVAIGIAIAMMNEFLGMVLALPDSKEKRPVILGVVWLLGFFSAFGFRLEFELLFFAFVGLFFYFLFTAHRHSASASSLEAHFREAAYTFSVSSTSDFSLFLPRIREQEAGALWLLLFLLINWVGDSAAYFVGLKKGKNKLYPEVSPRRPGKVHGAGWLAVTW